MTHSNILEREAYEAFTELDRLVNAARSSIARQMERHEAIVSK